ncbi:MAG: hypothetical protein U1E33_05905 [Rhodospirillales bacterium]
MTCCARRRLRHPRLQHRAAARRRPEPGGCRRLDGAIAAPPPAVATLADVLAWHAARHPQRRTCAFMPTMTTAW